MARPHSTHEVVPRSGGASGRVQWVRKQASSRTTVFAERAEAIARGHELGRANAPAELHVYGESGVVEARFVYDDPSNPKR